MYNWTIWYLSKMPPRLLKNSSHSLSVKGSSGILSVTRLCSPPLLFSNLLMIQLAAEPQTIRSISVLALAHEFQKCSRAGRKPEPAVSNHGSSSRNTIFFSLSFDSSNVVSRVNASSQFAAGGLSPDIVSYRHFQPNVLSELAETYLLTGVSAKLKIYAKEIDRAFNAGTIPTRMRLEPFRIIKH